MTNTSTLEEVKTQITERLEAWYTKESNIKPEVIYAKMKPGKRRRDLVATGEDDCPVYAYMERYCESNKTFTWSVGYDLFTTMIISDLISYLPEKYLRKFLKKIMAFDIDTASFEKMRDWHDAMKSSLHDKMRAIRTEAFFKTYRPELSALTLWADRYVDRAPWVRVNHITCPDRLWSAIPVMQLLKLQKVVYETVSDITGDAIRARSPENRYEHVRLQRVAEIQSGCLLLDASYLDPNAIRLQNPEINLCFKVPFDVMEAPLGSVQTSFRLQEYIRDMEKEIKELTKDGEIITPWSSTVEVFSSLFELFLIRRGERKFHQRFFPIETFAVIIHDLHLETQYYINSIRSKQ